MAHHLGKQAVVIGAGMGGLTAAAALSEFFDRVVVLDRDSLPGAAVPRSGVPQSAHTHGLLAGGYRALTMLFPGIEDDFAAGGAVTIDGAGELRMERPGYDPFPQRRLGVPFCCMSRPLVELTVRRRVERIANLDLRTECRAEELIAAPDGRGVAGVRHSAPGIAETLAADLVIDASGRGALTLEFLKMAGWPAPEETPIGMDMNYVTARFAVPRDAPKDWKGVYLLPKAPETSRGALLLPIEHDCWTVTMFAGHDDRPPSDDDGFHAFARSLRLPTAANAIKGAERVTPYTRFRFPGSNWKHFEQMADFPRGLLPLGDAVCRFNPVFGQGMSVAAQEAVLLRRFLSETAATADGLSALTPRYFAELPALLGAPWAATALDLAYPQTTGTRPPDFERQMKFGAAVTELAAREADAHQLFVEVGHLLKPRSAMRDPAFQARVEAVLAEMSARGKMGESA